MYRSFRTGCRCRSWWLIPLMAVLLITGCSGARSNAGKDVTASGVFGCATEDGQSSAAVVVLITGNPRTGAVMRTQAVTTGKGTAVKPLRGKVTIQFPAAAAPPGANRNRLTASLGHDGTGVRQLAGSTRWNPAAIGWMKVTINHNGDGCTAQRRPKIMQLIDCVKDGIVEFTMRVTYELARQGDKLGWVVTLLEFVPENPPPGNVSEVKVRQRTAGGPENTLLPADGLPSRPIKISEASDFDPDLRFSITTARKGGGGPSSTTCRSGWSPPPLPWWSDGPASR
jgi:hypothetical protein